MKLTTTLLAFAVGTMISSAYTLTVSNQGTFGGPSLPLCDNNGNPLTSGSVGVGFFGAGDTHVMDNQLDFAALLAGFTEYGTTTPVSGGVAPGLVNLVTPATWTVAVPSTSTAPQIGQNIYVVIGNGGTLAGSTELAIWKSDAIFGTEDDAGNGGAAVALDTGAGELLLGTEKGDTDVTAGANTITYPGAIGLVPAVPEPSTSLLGALAGLAFVARRRR